MYKLEFGQIEKRTAYIYEVADDGSFANQDNINWASLTGALPAVTMQFDEEGGTDYFPGQITKQAVKLTHYRTKENPSVMDDLITGEDNKWRMLILSGDAYLTRTFESDGVTSNKYWPTILNLTEGDVLFYGYLTNETYGEDYKPNASINLTFHDRLGELKEVVFEPANKYLSITELLNQLLDGLPLSKYLRIEFPYTVDGSAANPKDVVLDVTNFYGKKRNEVLKAFLKDFGLNLYVDYGYTEEESLEPNISERMQRCGVVTIRHWGKFQETEHTYYRYEKQAGVYEYIENETIYSVPKFMPEDYKIVVSGSWELVRRAKYLLAKSDYVLRNNAIQPYPLKQENLLAVDKDLNYPSFFASDYNYYTPDWATNPIISDWLKGVTTEGKTAVGNVGDSNKLGVKLVDRFNSSTLFIMSKPALMIKGDESFGLTIEAFSIKQMDVRYCLFAYNPETDDMRIWHKPASVAAWFSYTQGDSITPINLLNDITPNEYFSVTNDYNIPQPGAYSLGDGYCISLYLTYDNWLPGAFGAWITDYKLPLLTSTALPPSLTIRTNIAETRRSPIEEEFDFINLPKLGLLGNDQSFFFNGVYYRDPSTDAVSAPETLGYDGNEATLLVHQSELIGGQMTADRWAFKAKIIEPKAGQSVELITATWSGYVCETDSGDNTGYQRAATLRVITIIDGEVDSDNSYSLLDAIPDTAFGAITSNALAALSTVDYDARMLAFRAYVSEQDAVTAIGSYETNSPRGINETACPIPTQINISLTFEMTPGGTNHRITGDCVMERTLPLTDVTEVIDSDTSDLTAVFNPESSEKVDIDFSDVKYYIDSVEQTTYARWRYATPDAEWYLTDRVLKIEENTLVEVQISNSPFL